MLAPHEISSVWRQFAGIPMETFTKGWWYDRCHGRPRQRTVAEMVEHRRTHGAGGNCFDLALWLRHAFLEAGVRARITGHDLGAEAGHAAVVAADRAGNEYLCDLGDQWLQPVLISPAVDGWHRGFFPGREVQISRTDNLLQVRYRRSNGKVAGQSYDLAPVSEELVQQACGLSQNMLRRPFCEMLMPHPDTGKIEHWEYDKGRSFWNLESGPVFEADCQTQDEWVARIAARTGMAPDLIRGGFAVYR